MGENTNKGTLLSDEDLEGIVGGTNYSPVEGGLCTTCHRDYYTVARTKMENGKLVKYFTCASCGAIKTM